jgi:High potential iron-sulfur protein
MSSTRRSFMMKVIGTGAAWAAAQGVAQAAPPVDEADAQAKSLGYRKDTTKVDAKAFPKHTAQQKCGGCQLYQGKPGDAAGACGIFAGKDVSATGWCSAWMKKPA